MSLYKKLVSSTSWKVIEFFIGKSKFSYGILIMVKITLIEIVDIVGDVDKHPQLSLLNLLL